MTDLTTGGIPADAAAPSHGRVLRRLLRRPAFALGASGLAIIVLVAAFAPLLTSHDPLKQDLMRSLVPPFWVDGGSLETPLGTDTLGRDIASRLLFGARNSLVIALFAVALSSLLGLAAGLTAGFSRSWLDPVLMRLGDMQLAFPFILLAIIILGVIRERTVVHLVLVLGIPGWILYARVVRSRVLAERDKDYVTAARAVGAGRIRQVWRYVLPSIWMVVLVIAMLDFGFIILVEATLSFLGFGLTPPTPSWGGILAEGRRNLIIAPWLSILPGLAIMATVLAINLTADGAADVLDPRLKRGVFRRVRRQAVAAGNPHGHAGERGIRVAPEPAVAAGGSEPPLLEVRDLSVAFPFEDRIVRAVRHVRFTVAPGQAVGIVGESGSGKSVTAAAIIQLIEAPGQVTGGAILYGGRDLTRIGNDEMARLRGTGIGMIFQNPTSSLNPVLSIGTQMVETIRQHRKVAVVEARELAGDALRAIGIGDPRGVMAQYPFQLSGGMNQRVMIALAVLVRPDLLIADEPTTALDVTTQAVVLEQLRAVTRQHRTALILISHDIALVREYTDMVVVLYAGRVCESGPVAAVIRAPEHPYTQALLESVPRADLAPGERLLAIPGELPDPTATPQGCPFAPRCRYAMDVCIEETPPLAAVGPDRVAACHLDAVSAIPRGASAS